MGLGEDGTSGEEEGVRPASAEKSDDGGSGESRQFKC